MVAYFFLLKQKNYLYPKYIYIMGFIIRNKLEIVFALIGCFFVLNSNGQDLQNKCELQLTNGIQLSGMKPEDFTRNNFTYFNSLSIEKDITSKFQIYGGVTGYSFSTIRDFVIQKYSYFNVGLGYKVGPKFRLKAGSGILTNYTYNTATICLNYSMLFRIIESKYVDFYLTQGAIMGFGMYQTPPIEKDILPNFGFTLSMKVPKNKSNPKNTKAQF